MAAQPQHSSKPMSPDIARIRKAVESLLGGFSKELPELRMAVLSTADGRALTTYLVKGGDGSRMSAMVSSLLAICETATKELAAGACMSAIVVAERLNLVVIRLGDKARPLVLAAAFDADFMLGAALRKTSDIGTQITHAISNPGGVI